MREAKKSTPIVDMTQQPRSAVHVSKFMAMEACLLRVKQHRKFRSDFV